MALCKTATMAIRSTYHFNPQIRPSPTTRSSFKHPNKNLKIQSNFDSFRHNNTTHESNRSLAAKSPSSSSSSCTSTRICLCGRRHLLATIGTSLIPVHRSNSSNSLPEDPMDVLKRVRPSRPDWYEELYAFALDKLVKPYEAELLYNPEKLLKRNYDKHLGKIADYKLQLFSNLVGKAENILEIGIGTGPNLKYYGGATNGVNVIGTDPNRKMEKYAKAAAEAAGLERTNFKFVQAVGEALPVSDASMDAVVGTLVLCSVTDVDRTLQEVRRVLKPGGLYIFVEHVAAKDGTLHRFVQGALDPLQQFVADGCHLTRKTGDSISSAGFSSVDINTAFLSSASLVNPHAYGIACR